MAVYIEDHLPVVKFNGLNSAKAVNFSASSQVDLPSNTLVNGSPISGGSSPITSSSAQAFAVGQNGNTNPAFNVDASTGSSATGISIKSAAAGSSPTVQVTSSGTNEGLKIISKGTGTVSIQPTTDGTSFALYKADGTTALLTTNTIVGSLVSPAGGNGIKIQATSDGANTIQVVNNANNNAAFSVNTSTMSIVVASASTATAGGATVLSYGSSVVGIYAGSGAPTVSAPQGSIYMRTDGSSISTRMYINTNGSTTWTNVVTGA